MTVNLNLKSETSDTWEERGCSCSFVTGVRTRMPNPSKAGLGVSLELGFAVLTLFPFSLKL